jgi:cytochrome b subunit of formate dehydrogenase
MTITCQVFLDFLRLVADGTGIGRQILSILFAFNGILISGKQIEKCLCYLEMPL